ncbi:hypothetical protein [Polyangium sp. 6x1]|uniref:hypothetical protein n=1 Tax=Polyangium sp. 6x1 TaxID=3042689 RepID=UPI0024821D39|nr:hypothetical protein [Polyangium sp. 6x1]MDI1442691.1 hypothetical protein [Polyangium sp. 6x1]
MRTPRILSCTLPSTLEFFLVGVAACAGPSIPPAPTEGASPAPPSAPAAPTASATVAPAAAVPVAPAGPPSVGRDDAPGKRERARTAVLLFGANPEGSEEIRFVPVVCSLGGKLETGKACGLAMPATARVRTTRTDANAPAIVTVVRSTRNFHDEAGGRDYIAPTGPACCMYNTCVGETIPYLATGKPVVPPRALAIWPETAEVDLKPQPAGGGGVELSEGPWVGASGVRIEQALRAGGQRLVSTRGPCGSCGALWVERGGGFASVDKEISAADGFDILATSDVDGDGHSEAIVYEIWRNDYGLHVLGNDWSKLAYRFNCGNI